MKNVWRSLICCMLLLGLSQYLYAGELDGAKYKINSFRLDLAESVTYAQFLKEEEFSFVVLDTLELMLKRVNRLADKDDQSAMDLDINVDYYRRFVGDRSPWPIASLAPPNCIYTIVAKKNGTTIYTLKTDELTDYSGAFAIWEKDQPDYYKKDYSRAFGLALTIVNSIAEKAKDFAPPRQQELADLSVRAEQFHSKFGMPNKDVPAFYVPDEAAEPYIQAIKDSNPKNRINNFSAIAREWIYNEKLLIAVREHLEMLIANPITKDNEKELRYAMNALASFGIAEDSAVFEKIKNMSGLSTDVYKEVGDSNNILKKRSDQNRIVHQFSPETKDLPWEAKQLVNRLALADVKDVLQAISRIKRAYPKDPAILAAMKRRLEKEALVFNYKARMYVDVDAHMCRTIGSSGNPEYFDFMEMIATTAAMDYTRAHCIAGLEVLRSLNKEIAKKRDEEKKLEKKLAKEKAKEEKKLKNKEK